ncbi:TRAP transporter fused permease subunit [Pikeienuella piscinae]|uniref:TRAP transporter fused permease subunit n=1 Tax=Pikeienuella piscinae TaxID=2748098 RepID=A0A7L5BW37_9RHOB|nr:TRAP transporter fused permease subunit [Pikeienuella piscinae]QIE56610.1 TRAP transporter fused permease subunit [Pikeienuella piscinae]
MRDTERAAAAPRGMYALRAARAASLTIGFALAVQSLYTAYFGVWEPWFHRSLVTLFSVAAVTLSVPLAARVRTQSRLTPALCWLVDALMIVIFTLAVEQLFAAYEHVDDIMLSYSPYQIAISVLAVGCLLELSRRLFGLPLLLFCLAVFLYCIFGNSLPWVFHHSGFTLSQTMETLWFGLQGVFGSPLGVVVQIIFVFIVFGVVLERTGAGEALIRLAFHFTARSRGGPAQAAIVASALFGTMSGSVAANVVGTGSFTIPIIKRRGFAPHVAGGVEAAASTGGQFVPPVMGAAAFVMADITGIPYLQICLAALIPAILYYLSLAGAVALEARKRGIAPTPPAERVALTRRDSVMSLMVLGPIAAIVVVLAEGRSPAMAGFWATVVAVGLAFLLNPEMRRKPRTLLVALADGGIAGAGIVVAVACIGVVLGVLNLTGFGLKFAGMISAAGEGDMLVSLLLTMFACLILGMGMPTLPAYLIIVLVMGGAITRLGAPTIAVHMFVLYFGVLSAVTPPVALAAFAAAPIAGANPIVTAVTALRLSIAGFVIPFLFVFNPELLLILEFEPTGFVWTLIRAAAALWLMTTALAGFERGPLALWSRLARLIVVGFILQGDLLFSVIGLALAAVLIARDWLECPGLGAPVENTRKAAASADRTS